MTDADAVAKAVVTGVTPPDNPAPATQHNQTDGKAAAATDAWGTVDEPLRKVIEAKGWKAPVDALKSYIALEQYASKPVQDMNPEEREKFHKRLGRPESPDGYELTTSVIPPEGFPQRPKEADKEFRELMHKVHTLPLKDQPKALLEWSMTKAVQGFAAQKQAEAKALEQNESDLRKAWGLEYEANRAISDRAAKLGDDDFVQWLNKGPGKLAVVRKYLLAVGKSISDEGFVGGDRVAREANARPGMVVDFSKTPELTGAKR